MIRDIADHLAALRWADLSEAAQRKLQLCVLANLCVAVAGGPALRLPRAPSGEGHLLLDRGSTGSAREAAFHNGALMHARTQDDFHPVGNLHIATVVLPALLAQAERQEAAGKPVGGEAFLAALAVGYGVAAGLSARYSPVNTPRGLRSTSLYSGMGAAAAVAHLAGTGAAGIANALGLASQSSFGTTQCWRDGSDEYQLHTANAASQALLALDLTQAGVRAGEHALDGPSGFYPALLGVTPVFAEIAEDFSAEASILESVLKRYPVSGICQPVVRLSERLAAQLQGRKARALKIEMNEFEMNYPGTLNAGPVFRSFSDRLMSARFCAGSVFTEGRFSFQAFVGEPGAALQALVANTEVRPGADLGTLSCRVAATLDDGSELAGELRDGGRELAIDWDTIGEWGVGLWREAGRPEAAYWRLMERVKALPEKGFAALRGALAA